MTHRMTVYGLQSRKGVRRRPATRLHCRRAAAAIEAGINMPSCEPDRHLDPIRAAALAAFLSVGLPHGGTYPEPRRQVDMGDDAFDRLLALAYSI
ncbi:hypothetical protein LXM94_09430 [Rhizobium sp. TRM95111]|uniref:hypothetical protein n=1 Tax=Rhizobium alarense TaxID=2846851 RepID=UPI001F376EEF|nr:hypothetical protein [Rhizobium alarense]MCF3640190.1 hypothetical protein [Rhizobium alarense]